MSWTSEVEIVNSALIKLGEDPIQSLDDDNKRARVMKSQYPIKRDELVRSHPWNFAIDRREFAADVTAPLYKYLYSYIIPNDVFRILDTNVDEEYEWFKEGKRIITDATPFKCRCLVQRTDVSYFDLNFGEALATILAADASYAITQTVSVKDRLVEDAKMALQTARSFDAQEGSVQRVVADNWTRVRA